MSHKYIENNVMNNCYINLNYRSHLIKFLNDGPFKNVNIYIYIYIYYDILVNLEILIAIFKIMMF